MKIITAFCLLILILIFDSCNSYDYEKQMANVIEKATLARKNKFKNIRDSSYKLVFSLYDYGQDSTILFAPNKIIWTDSTTNVNKIAKFNNLFTNLQDGGYCWPGVHHYSISFYNNKNSMKQYFVDTSAVNGKAMFFDGGYQASYYVDLKDWKSLLADK